MSQRQKSDSPLATFIAATAAEDFQALVHCLADDFVLDLSTESGSGPQGRGATEGANSLLDWICRIASQPKGSIARVVAATDTEAGLEWPKSSSGHLSALLAFDGNGVRRVVLHWQACGDQSSSVQ